MTAAVESSDEHIQESGKNASPVDALTDQLEETGIQSDAEDTQAVAEPEILDSRPRIVYSRKQLVHLSQSPLIKIPDGMPSFKSWFGSVFAVARSRVIFSNVLVMRTEIGVNSRSRPRKRSLRRLIPMGRPGSEGKFLFIAPVVSVSK